MRALKLALVLAFVGCNHRGALVVVTVEATPGALTTVDHFHTTVLAIGGSRDFDLRAPGTPASTPFTFGIDLPPAAAGAIAVHVECFDSSGRSLGAGDGAGTISPGARSDVTVEIGSSPRDMLALDAADLETPDLSSVDFAGVDMGPDLAMPSDMATCVLAGGATAYVDPALGHDDTQHGGAAGSCAFKTITFALKHATALIELKNTALYQSQETFPIVLNGAQVLDGDPGSTGTQARIVGLGSMGAAYGAVFLMGTNSQIRNCDVSTPAGAAVAGNVNSCLQVTTNGSQIVDTCTLHDCGVGIYSVGIYLNGASGATISNTSISNVQNCTNELGNNVIINSTACVATGYFVSNCGSNLTGCGNSNAAGGLGLCSSCTCPSSFLSACM